MLLLSMLSIELDEMESSFQWFFGKCALAFVVFEKLGEMCRTEPPHIFFTRLPLR